MKTYGSFIGTTKAKEQLNPKFWTEDNQLKPRTESAIREKAEDFVKKLGLPKNSIEDIRIVGGSAGYNWHDSSDIDVTLMIDRNLDLDKDQIRRLGISASNLTYRLSPSIDGVDLNFYVSSRNVGPLRPSKQSVYSLNKERFLVGPFEGHEVAPNYLASRANQWVEQIESCIEDDSNEAQDCSQKLLARLKRYRLAGLKSKDGEESTQALVWKILSRSGYIGTLKSKVAELEKQSFQINTNDLLESKDYRQMLEFGVGQDSIPNSILSLERRIRQGLDPLPVIRRMRSILDLFDEN